jgi:hypothetical protein
MGRIMMMKTTFYTEKNQTQGWFGGLQEVPAKRRKTFRAEMITELEGDGYVIKETGLGIEAWRDGLKQYLLEIR